MDEMTDLILREIDEHTHPESMSKKEAKEWLEELATDIDGRIEALKEEMEKES